MILNTLDHLGKFEAKGDEGYFIGYSIYIALPNWVYEALLESSSSNAQDTCNADAPESSGNPNPTATTTNPPADQMETLTVETPIPIVSSPVPTACFEDSLKPSSTTRVISKRVTSQDVTPSLDNISTLVNMFDDILGVTTSTVDSHGEEADVRNIETTITASPTPTLRIHKDHPKSQIIGPVDTPIQTRNKSKEMEEHSFIATIHQKTNLALLQFCLFSCFLSQVEPKKISDAFKTQAGIEAIILFLAYASFMGFTVYQIDVKSAFLYGTIDEEVPDIMFAVYAYARHQVTPKECHLHAVKRIFRYLKGHPKLGLWYPKKSPFDLVAYSDSDYSAASGCEQVLWIQNQLLDYGWLAYPIGDDSQGAACPTGSGLEEEHDRGNIAKTSTLPSDSTPRVTSLAADKG
nr:hypothetical protein [Tanacetum cinerariifolium]